MKLSNSQFDRILTEGVNKNVNSYNKDLLIYLHIPFCKNKCNYCCWTARIPSKSLRDKEDIQNLYVDALCTQIQNIGPKLMSAGYNPKLIAWGGGTPSILSIKNLEKIIKTLHNSFDLSKIVEHTFEANPCSLNGEKISFLSTNGINRISVGVQSFNNAELKILGRAHSAEDAIDSISSLKKNGIDNYNIDLLFAYPTHSMETWLKTVAKAISLDPTHITTYLFNNVPNTALYNLIKRGKYEVQTMETMLRLHQNANEFLKEKGFYENYAQCYIKKPEHQHKSEYYAFATEGDYIGFGNGANSSIMQHFLSNNADDNSLNRFVENPIHFDNCLKYSPTIFDNNKEYTYIKITNALYTSKGINFKNFYNHYGFGFNESEINTEFYNIAKNTDLINVSDEKIFIPDKNRNIVYIKYLLQLLRKRMMNKQYCNQISN